MGRGPYADRRIPQLSDTHLARFWAKVERTSSCWHWRGATTGHPTHPYGRFRIGTDQFVAHRIAYTLTHGEIGNGYVTDHLCRNTLCVRPEHLRLVSQSENLAAGVVARNPRGRFTTTGVS